MSSANSPLPQLNTEDQQGGRGATAASSAPLSHNKGALLKKGKLSFSKATLHKTHTFYKKGFNSHAMGKSWLSHLDKRHHPKL